MLCEFYLYLDAKRQKNQELPVSDGTWKEIEELLQEDRSSELVYPIEAIQKTALESAHSTSLPADREGWKHLYHFLAGIRRSERVIDRALARKEVARKKQYSTVHMRDHLRAALTEQR